MADATHRFDYEKRSGRHPRRKPFTVALDMPLVDFERRLAEHVSAHGKDPELVFPVRGGAQ